jgi:hypothetical protein
MSKQIIAYGGKVERSTNGSSWTEIPEVQGIAVPTVTTDFPEVTNLDSPDGFREYIKGMKDAGEISLSCGYTADGYEQQLADEALDDPVYYKVTLRAAPGQSTGDVFEYRGFPTPSLVDNGVGSPIGMTISIRTTGDVQWTKGTAAAT